MYANDVMTMTELKEKTAAIAEELERLDCSMKQYAQMIAFQKNGEDYIRRYIQDIEQFLNMETVTNIDMRKVISRITVNKDKTIKIELKKFDIDDIL